MPKSTWAIILGAGYDVLQALILPHLLPPGVATAVSTAIKVVIDDFFPGAV